MRRTCGRNDDRIRPGSPLGESGRSVFRSLAPEAGNASVISVERPGKFEHFRWVGDKRTRTVYDVDALSDPRPIDELMAAGTYLCFGPDTLAEARNRGYRPFNGTGHD